MRQAPPSAGQPPRPRPPARPCSRCRPTPAEIQSGYVVISPQNVAHHGGGDGWTQCGIDATGPWWWWPL
jgi:hypothetical protein